MRPCTRSALLRPRPSFWPPPGGGGLPNVSNPEDFIAGYFEKYVSDDSARSLLESLKWQRRFFVFSESTRVLYYFKSPEDVTKPTGLRGQINVAGGWACRWGAAGQRGAGVDGG